MATAALKADLARDARSSREAEAPPALAQVGGSKQEVLSIPDSKRLGDGPRSPSL